MYELYETNYMFMFLENVKKKKNSPCARHKYMLPINNVSLLIFQKHFLPETIHFIINFFPLINKHQKDLEKGSLLDWR